MKILTVIILGLCCFNASAQAVQDPTRPKAGHLGSSQAIDEDVLDEMQALKLQSVLNKKSGKMAIISGELYSKGDAVNDYILSEIHKSYVVLVGSDSKKRLYLYE